VLVVVSEMTAVQYHGRFVFLLQSMSNMGRAVISQGSLFSQSFVSHRYLYVTFDLSLRHHSIQFSRVDLIGRQQNKNPLLR
jgi:hypothetical protein